MLIGRGVGLGVGVAVGSGDGVGILVGVSVAAGADVGFGVTVLGCRGGVMLLSSPPSSFPVVSLSTSGVGLGPAVITGSGPLVIAGVGVAVGGVALHGTWL